MNTTEFDIMDPLQKINLLSENGVMLAFRIEGSFQVSLFQMGSFYAEIYFHAVQRCIKLVRSFTDTSELDSYLNEINICELINTLEYKR